AAWLGLRVLKIFPHLPEVCGHRVVSSSPLARSPTRSFSAEVPEVQAKNQSRPALPYSVSVTPSSWTTAVVSRYAPFSPPPFLRWFTRVLYDASVRPHSASR